MEPSAWGPFVWSAIHLICLGAPSELSSFEQEQYQQFFNYLTLVIPCASCRVHLKENLRRLPIQSYLKSRDSLFEWSVKLHNLVNQKLGVKEWAIDDAKKHWDKVASGVCETARCEKNILGANWRRMSALLVLLIGGVGLMWWYFISEGRLRKC